MDSPFRALPGREEPLRQLEPSWNYWLVAASIVISLLGAFTSTQLMCQARMSLRLSSVLVWTILGSLNFGFCSIWSLHFVAMLACELDLPIGINVPLTLLSAALAVFFTFAALASDLLWDRYKRRRQGENQPVRRKQVFRNHTNGHLHPYFYKPLSDRLSREDNNDADHPDEAAPLHTALSQESGLLSEEDADLNPFSSDSQDSSQRISFDSPGTTYPASMSSDSSSLGKVINLDYMRTLTTKNVFIATWEGIYRDLTFKNILKGFSWSLAITSMHYVGIIALRIPKGYITLDSAFVVISALISWSVCLVGCILMSQMETHLSRQFLFSIVATTGVAAMHFTGMRAITFWSYALPSEARGYPSALPVAIVSIAIITCILANGLLAHAATVSRNKLAEIVVTRRKLWRTIAQKENAEAAAAARSEFIALASHEIRTPLHHLQGYSELLSKTELTEEGRRLLFAIQRAANTLSLITNNVLDWSKLENDTEVACRSVALDMRTVCESIIVLLPNKDDDANVELMVVVTSDVPDLLFLDETYIHRILMNLLSNALKFTTSGYILLFIEINDNKLVATIKDTGCGIPESFLPQLFEPFKQAQTRGSQRGTGLGLSIIKQLLHKMQGTIEVESKYPETQELNGAESGTTITVKIPVHLPDPPHHHDLCSFKLPRVAIFECGSGQSTEGLYEAWQKFDFDPVIVKDFSELLGCQWKYIWVDIPFLKRNPIQMQQLIEHDEWLVLVPYDDQSILKEVSGLHSALHFIPIQRPLVWHTFQRCIATVNQPSNRAALLKSVRFASQVNLLEHNPQPQSREEPAESSSVILLVEDNPINQKLGKKMLEFLGHTVLIAENGQDAIEQITRYDDVVDLVLMDQSMPQKDGVTATKEIRAMEAAGILSRRHPILAVTAVVSAKSQAMFKAAGSDDFLAKPLSMGKLEFALAEYLPSK